MAIAVSLPPAAPKERQVREFPSMSARSTAAVLPLPTAGDALRDSARGTSVAEVAEAIPDCPIRPLPRTESEYVDRLIAGDEAAYEDLVRQHCPQMLAVATRYLRRVHDAEDAVQDALLNVVRHIATFKRESRLETWLHRIVVNCALMRLRSQRRKPHLTLDDPDVRSGANLPRQRVPPLSAHEVVEGAETSRIVQDSINHLPVRQRQIVQLRDIAALEMGQVAEVLDLGLSTARVTAHRAHLRLKCELGRSRRRSDACPSC